MSSRSPGGCVWGERKGRGRVLWFILRCAQRHFQPCVVWTPTMPLTECLQVSPSSSLKMGKTAPASMTTWQVYMRLGCKNVSIPSFSFTIQKIRRLSLVCMKSSLGSQNLEQCSRQTLKSRLKFSAGWSTNPPGPRRDSPCPVLTPMSAEQQSPRHSHRFPAHHGCPREGYGLTPARANN